VKLVTLARRLGGLLLTVIITALCLVGFLGCGMLGNPDTYYTLGSALAQACSKCHAPNAQPSKANAKPESERGMEGPGGSGQGCPVSCPYARGQERSGPVVVFPQ
jgi:hypothetical protein